MSIYFLIFICIALVFPNFVNIVHDAFLCNSVHACSFSQSILTL